MDSSDSSKEDSILTDRLFGNGNAGAYRFRSLEAVICIFAFMPHRILPHRERCKMQRKDERAANCVRRLRNLIGFTFHWRRTEMSIFNTKDYKPHSAASGLNTQINPFKQGQDKDEEPGVWKGVLGKCQIQAPIKNQTMAIQMREMHRATQRTIKEESQFSAAIA